MEDNKLEKTYSKIFNFGYLLHKHEPVLLDDIIKSSNKGTDTFRIIGLGKKQYEIDKLSYELAQNREEQNPDFIIE